MSLVENQKNAVRTLIWVTIVCVIFMAIEVVGGVISGSLALISDAIHMLTDFSGFLVSFVSICISKKSPSKRLSYGYHRAEIIGALISVLMIWIFTVWIVWEGVDRVINQNYQIDGLFMGITAFIGLLANILMGKILHSHVIFLLIKILLMNFINITFIFISFFRAAIMVIVTEDMDIVMEVVITVTHTRIMDIHIVKKSLIKIKL